MDELQIFKNEEFGDIRAVSIDGEPWLVGKDVAKVLGYTNPQDALKNHVDAEDKKMGEPNATPYILDSMNRKQYPTFINESGFYSLVLGSKIPAAKKFKRWVTSEVLPQIRKTGGYIPVAQEDDEMTIMAKAVLIANNTLKQKDELIAKQAQQLQEQKPLVDFANHVASTDDLIDMAQMAKLLADKGIKIGRNRLFELLREKGILMSTYGHKNEPYQRYIEQGYFKTKETVVDTTTRSMVKITTYITGTGQKFIYSLVSAAV